MIRSFPELAAQRWHLWRQPLKDKQRPRPDWSRLAPIYRLGPADTPEQRQRKLHQLMAFLHQRFTRLRQAWPAWETFDVGAYFDLYPDQAAVLCEIRVRNDRLQAVFFVDLLVPSFRRALHYWQTEVIPAYRQVQLSLAGRRARPTTLQYLLGTAFSSDIMPEFDALYQEARVALRQSILPLARSGDVHFLAHSAACLERLRVAKAYREPEIREVIARLDRVPTLTVEHTVAMVPNGRQRRRERLARRRYFGTRHRWAL